MMEKLEWKASRFEELTTRELYDVLHLRSKIFVLEQKIPYLDMDYEDQKAIHLHGYVGDKLVAYCRFFKSGDYLDQACIGRVLVAEEYRKCGYGHDLIEKAIEEQKLIFGETKIVISAQSYLQKFYEGHGFECISEVFLIDSLPHIQMKKE